MINCEVLGLSFLTSDALMNQRWFSCGGVLFSCQYKDGKNFEKNFHFGIAYAVVVIIFPFSMFTPVCIFSPTQDPRFRQLLFLVKAWAKARGVNDSTKVW